MISAAHDLVDTPAEEIIAMAVREVRKVLPAARAAELVHARVIKEKRATFSARPGVDALRPAAAPAAPHGIGNLFLAGDWTATGWPATMEGAARSGYLAAGAVLKETSADSGAAPLVPDLPPDSLYHLLSGRL